MPDPQSQPATAKKLGGIPQGEESSPTTNRKSPTFKMKAIDRPPRRRAASRPSALPTIATVLGLLVAIGGPAAYFSIHPSPQLVALLQPLEPRAEAPPAPDVAFSSAPAETTPRPESEPGYLWLFDETEWRAASTGRELRDGLLHLRSTLAKPQPAADATIRARVRAQESGDASIFLRSTKTGRYRLTVDGDRRYVRLIHDGASGPSELGKVRFYKTLEPRDWITLELRAEDSDITGSVNGKEVIFVKDTQSTMAGNWGIESNDGWYQMVEIPAPKPKKAVASAKSEPEPAPEPKPAPAPAAPAPAPMPAVVLSETAKWLAGLEAQWQTTFQEEVMAPYEKGTSDLRKQFRETIETQFTAAQAAKKFDDVAFFRGEKKRLDDGEDVPMTDEPIVPVSLKTLRNGYRNELVRLDRERFNRAKGFFSRIESQLTQSQAALVARKRNEEAAEVKAKRDQLAAMWLKPPLTLATPAPLAGTTPPGATPAAGRPAIGATPAPSLARLPLRQVVEKLLAMGAEVHVTPKAGGNPTEVKAIGDLTGDKFVVTQVDFRVNVEGKKPPTTEDLMIVEALDDATDLSLRGAGVTDAVFEKMKNFRHLDRLTLEGTKLTAAGLAVLPTFSELHELNLYDFPLTDEAAKWVGQARKLERIRLATSPITDAGLGFIAKLTGLQELDLNNCDKLGGASVAHLVGTHSLKRLNIGGSLVSSPMLDALAKCTSLETLTLSGNPLKDEQVAVLGTLTRLHTLNLNNTGLVGTAFTNWSTRTSLTSLNFVNQPGVTDAALKAIGMAFPKLENLDITAAPGVTVTGFTSVSKLRSLRNLHVNGATVTDDIAVEIAKCSDLQTLNLPGAKIGDPGVAAISRLAKLANLQLDIPPETDAALKSLARCKTLKTLQIGSGSSAEVEAKIKAALPAVTVTKRGEG